MALSNGMKVRRFYDGRETPPSCRGMRSSGERLYSYGFELARHGLSHNGNRIVLIRDRCRSTVTTQRHWREAYAPGATPLSPANYSELLAKERRAPVAVPHIRDMEYFFNPQRCPDDLLWSRWLDKLEEEYGKDARSFAVRRIRRFRSKMDMNKIIDAL